MRYHFQRKSIKRVVITSQHDQALDYIQEKSLDARETWIDSCDKFYKMLCKTGQKIEIIYLDKITVKRIKPKQLGGELLNFASPV